MIVNQYAIKWKLSLIQSKNVLLDSVFFFKSFELEFDGRSHMVLLSSLYAL